MQRSACASALAVAAILLLTFPEALAIRCFQCNSRKDQGCEGLSALPPNATVPDPASDAARYLVTCKDGPGGEPAFCRKSLIIVLAANDGEGEARWVRACGWVKHKRECYNFDDADHQEEVCQCFTDGCNAAPTPAPTRAQQMLMLLPAALLAVAGTRLLR